MLVTAVIAGSAEASHVVTGQQRPGPAAAPATQAAAWVAAQVSRADVVSCDLAMCQALQAHGFPVSDLLLLGPRGAGALVSQVVVATAAVRREFGGRLSSVYAPVVLASFGSGSTRIDVRVIAPDGAAAYLSALRADQQQRKSLGAELAGSARIIATAVARRQMGTGQVAAQVLVVITALVTLRPVDILAFGDSGPRATAGMPLRSVYLADNGGAAARREILAFLRVQRGPYRPARAGITRFAGRPVLFVEFAAPTPLGLIDGPPASAHS